MLAVVETVRNHWPEYLMEAAGLGLFMVSAAVVTTLLEYPASSLHEALPDPTIRRGLIGVAMGLTAVALIYSPWGARSGAHLNPAVTLTFLRLGKIQWVDALGYVVGQFVGGTAGLLMAVTLIGIAVRHPAVNYAVTVPYASPTRPQLSLLTDTHSRRMRAKASDSSGFLWVSIQAKRSMMQDLSPPDLNGPPR